MKIEWNQVTRVSQVVAILLFLVVYFIGFAVGRKYENKSVLGNSISVAKFVCADGKSIDAEFYKNFVHINTKKLGSLYLPQTISGSGARYANADESVVFWNKGVAAFITEGDSNFQTYKECLTK
ncbi:MliC family protein [Patescibacteria group bacterium]|nr:MliC family protein [Patescibacteria group bacterium]